MKLIVGLGNPGLRYNLSRHNIGFISIDRFALDHDIAISNKGFNAFFGKGKLVSADVLLAKPQTYMNLSGISVKQLVDYYKIDTKDLIVIHDDLDLSYSTIRLKAGGGHGGHKGLISIIEHLGSPEFIRVRIGIGKPPNKMMTESYVLESLKENEMKLLPHIISKVSDALITIISLGVHAAMNIYNVRAIDKNDEEVS